jgi:hypothetical protein
VEFGDRGTTVTVYKLSSYADKIVEILEHKCLAVGGYHITKAMTEWVVEAIKKKKGIDVGKQKYFMSLLYNSC